MGEARNEDREVILVEGKRLATLQIPTITPTPRLLTRYRLSGSNDQPEILLSIKRNNCPSNTSRTTQAQLNSVCAQEVHASYYYSLVHPFRLLKPPLTTRQTTNQLSIQSFTRRNSFPPPICQKQSPENVCPVRPRRCLILRYDIVRITPL